MAWDNSLPIDNQKLRTLASVIRHNFVAIETGDSTFQFDAVNLEDQAGDPTAISGAFLLYSKTISGQVEMFGINENSDVIQLTSGLLQ